MKKTVAICLIFVLGLQCFAFPCFAEDREAVLDLECPSAILIERSTGRVLYKKDENARRPMASVTKIMTMLLIMEALKSQKFTTESMVTCSARAVSMGGSQVYLKEGETMSVGDMLKAIAVASANDAAVAMAEFVAGSEQEFIKMMNDKAAALGMKNTHFVNCTGLDADDHYSSANDIALMSRELLKYDKIKDYTTIWMGTLRDGKFGLSNTNKLVRFYQDCTGLKTGSTSKALYCMSASAERNGMELIAVVLAAPTSPKRFDNAKKLLDYGFANYEIFKSDIKIPTEIEIEGAKDNTAPIAGTNHVELLVEKGKASKINIEVNLDTKLQAPAEKGTKVGKADVICDEKIIESFPILLQQTVPKAKFVDIFLQLVQVFLSV